MESNRIEYNHGYIGDSSVRLSQLGAFSFRCLSNFFFHPSDPLKLPAGLLGYSEPGYRVRSILVWVWVWVLPSTEVNIWPGQVHRGIDCDCWWKWAGFYCGFFLEPLSILRASIRSTTKKWKWQQTFPISPFLLLYFSRLYLFFFFALCYVAGKEKFMQVLGTLFQEFSLFSQDYDFIKIMCRADGQRILGLSGLGLGKWPSDMHIHMYVGENKHTHQ